MNTSTTAQFGANRTSPVSQTEALPETLLAKAQYFVDCKYVARSDERQRSMGLAYVEVERQDLAREIVNFTMSCMRGHAQCRQQWQPIETAPERSENALLLYFPAIVTGSHQQARLPVMYRTGHPDDFPNRRPTHFMQITPPDTSTLSKSGNGA